MESLSKFILLLLIGFFIASCGDNSIEENQSELPDSPEKIVFEWSEGGGMFPEGSDIFISDDSAFYQSWYADVEQKLYFQVSKKEMDSLYAIFKLEKFDQIRLIEEGEVYDRGGISIRLTADNKFFSKNISGGTFVEEAWNSAFNKVSDALVGFTMKKIENQKVKVTVGYDKKILEENLKLYISINGHSILDTEVDAGNFYLDTLIYNAQHVFEATVYDKDSINSFGDPAFLETVFVHHEGFNQVDTIYFYWSENQVKVRSF